MNRSRVHPTRFDYWSCSQHLTALLRRVGLVVTVTILGGWPTEAHAACYVAFIPGHQDTAPSGNPEHYWNPEVTKDTPPGSGPTLYSFTHWAAVQRGCTVTRISWDSRYSYRSKAPDVAAKIGAFISANAIADGQLILIAHSMGGLVTRYILNNASSASAGYRASFATIAKATKYLITSQTPHTGSRAADAAAGEADSSYVDVFGSVAQLLGYAKRDSGTDSMRRLELEYGSAAGGSMGDAFRSKRIYTIEGYRVGSAAGPATPPGSANTTHLETAWAGLCYQNSPLNLYLCPNVPGDGLVEQRSAAGILQRSGTWDGSRYAGVLYPTNYSTSSMSTACSAADLKCKHWSNGSMIRGARTRWLKYGGDHDQGRYDRHATNLVNYISGKSSLEYLGTYIGHNGYSLPH